MHRHTSCHARNVSHRRAKMGFERSREVSEAAPFRHSRAQWSSRATIPHRVMSKAFTREDDHAGFELASRPPVVRGAVTAVGSRLAAEKARTIAARLDREADPSARGARDGTRAGARARLVMFGEQGEAFDPGENWEGSDCAA